MSAAQKASPTKIIKKVPHFKTVLITGVASYIGSQLAIKLIEEGIRVVGLDNFVHGSKKYLDAVISNPRFTLVKHDISEGLPREIQSVDYIFHLSANQIHLYGKEKDSLKSFLANTEGTKNILEFAADCEAQLLLASTVEIYKGEFSHFSLKDYFGQTAFERSKNSFLQSKKFSESLLWEYVNSENLNARIVRLPAVFGPNFLDENPEHDLARFLEASLKGESIEIFGSGLDKEFYLYIDDAVSGLLKAQFDKDSKGKIYPISNLEGTTVLELAYLIKSLSNGNVEVVFKQSLGQEYPDYQIIDGQTLEDLGWKQQVDLREGILQTLKNTGERSEKVENVRKREEMLKELKSKVKQAEEIKQEAKPDIPCKEETPNYLSEDYKDAALASEEIHKPEILIEKNIINKPKKRKEIKIFSPKVKLFFKKVPEKENTARFKNLFSKNSEKEEYKFRFKSRPHKKALKLLTISALLLISPFAALITTTLLSSAFLYKAAVSAKEMDFEKAASSSKVAATTLKTASNITHNFYSLLKIPLGSEKTDCLEKLLRTGYYGAQTINLESQGLITLKSAIIALSPGSSIKAPTQSEFIAASANFNKGLERFLLLEGEIKNLKQDQIPSKFSKYLNYLNDEELNLKGNLTTLKETMHNLPEILALTGPKKYLILLQNHHELRATGGFIGSYALLTLENGKIKDLVVDDIYNIDGIIQEKEAEIEAPAQIKAYLNLQTIGIRDSNYSPDFSETAEKIYQLYESATGEKPDGVFALNLVVIKDILEQIGPIEVPEFGTINSNNIFEKSVFYSEKNYFEGSQAKKNFLGSLSNTLFSTVLADPKNFLKVSFLPIYKNLQGKNILINTYNETVSEPLIKRGWGGRVAIGNENDFLMLVEQNMGANKANYSMLRSIKYEVKEMSREGELEAKLTLNYSNEAAESKWPLGTYKMFAQLITLPNVETEDEFIFYKEIEPGNFWIKQLSWKLPKNLNSNNYSLKVQKQPGMENTPFTFNYSSILGGRDYSYEGYLTKDMYFVVQ